MSDLLKKKLTDIKKLHFWIRPHWVWILILYPTNCRTCSSGQPPHSWTYGQHWLNLESYKKEVELGKGTCWGDVGKVRQGNGSIWTYFIVGIYEILRLFKKPWKLIWRANPQPKLPYHSFPNHSHRKASSRRGIWKEVPGKRNITHTHTSVHVSLLLTSATDMRLWATAFQESCISSAPDSDLYGLLWCSQSCHHVDKHCWLSSP